MAGIFRRTGAQSRFLRQMARSAVLAGLLAIAAPVSGLVSGAATAQTIIVSSIVVQGNQRLSDANVIGIMGLNRGRLTAAQINEGQQKLVNSGLFEAVEVRPAGSSLVVRVREYPVINRVAVEGNRRLRDDALAPAVQSQPRSIYSPTRAAEDAARIAELYAERGRIAATVTPKIIRRGGNRVDLVFEVLEGRVTEVERITFVGNRSFSDRRLRQVLATKQAGILRQIIQRDTISLQRLEVDRRLLRDFYLSRGFIDVEVLSATPEVTPGRDASFLTFNIREGQSYRYGRVTAVSELPDVDATPYQALIRARPGNLFSPVTLDAEVRRLEEYATRQGLRFVRVDPRVTRNDAERTLDIELVLVRGPRVFVERIDIEGNATTLDRVIRRQFRSVEGDPFNPREVAEAAERIRVLGYFAEVDVDTREGSGPDQVIVDVGVEETTTGSLGFGINFGSQTGVGIAIQFTEQNFLGRGQEVSLNLVTGTDFNNFSATFVEPSFLGRDLRFALDAFYNTTAAQDEFFNRTVIGIQPAFRFNIARSTQLELRYRYEVDRLRFTPANLAASSPIVTADSGTVVKSMLGYTLAYDTRRTGFDPNSGIILRLSQDFAGLGGASRFVKTSALIGAETKVFNEEVTLRAELEGGILVSNGASRITDRFDLSSNIVRGFGRYGAGPRDLNAPNRDALLGNRFVAARFEAEFPIGLPEEYGISGGLFFDIGSVWGLDNTTGFGGAPVDDSLRWRSAVGVSIFWNTPLGPLRFNFARPLARQPYDRTQSFDVTISARF